jgi:indolepyruvate ferredoxin oxidoreductase
VSVLIYDQTCAAEKRRRRKRGTFPDPGGSASSSTRRSARAAATAAVKSNCLSVEPVETEFGRKRAIDQSSCNKDFSCQNGFCPSFVSVEGGSLRKGKAVTAKKTDAAAKPAEPDMPAAPALPSVTDKPYGVLITGIGGTGVVTIGAIMGMAAHIEGKGATVLDQLGMAQKGGAVISHTHETITGEFTRHPDLAFPANTLKLSVEAAAGADAVEFLDATGIATSLMGDSIATNMFVLGYAYQKGFIPLAHESIERAIELNGAAVPMNLAAFRWGRRAAHDRAAVETLVAPKATKANVVAFTRSQPRTLDEIVASRTKHLTGYQNAALAQRYKALVDKVRATEQKIGQTGLADAVALYYAKLLAYKDEYEVARLYSEAAFQAGLNRQFEGDYKLKFHLAPPLFSSRDPQTGELIKQEFGAWMLPAFRMLAKLKGLRGTKLDVFGYTEERKTERKLIADYETLIAELLATLSPQNHALAIKLASIPDDIRGYGHVKDAHLAKAKKKEADLLHQWRNPEAMKAAAE